jgi:hypothetical protein
MNDMAYIWKQKNLCNVVVEWLSFLLRIWEIPVSNLGPETGKYRDRTLQLSHDRFLSNPFQFIIHLSPFIRRYAVLVTENA